MHKGTEVPLDSCLVTRSELPRASLFLRQLERKNYRLRIDCLLDLQSSPTGLPTSLSHPVETGTSPSKIHCAFNALLVEMAGVEPASRMPSLS